MCYTLSVSEKHPTTSAQLGEIPAEDWAILKNLDSQPLDIFGTGKTTLFGVFTYALEQRPAYKKRLKTILEVPVCTAENFGLLKEGRLSPSLEKLIRQSALDSKEPFVKAVTLKKGDDEIKTGYLRLA